MKRVEYFPRKMAEREAALVASPASGQDWDRPTAPGQFRSFAEEDSIRVVSEVNCTPLEPPVGEFNLSRLERVIYGPGKIAADGGCVLWITPSSAPIPCTAELA